MIPVNLLSVCYPTNGSQMKSRQTTVNHSSPSSFSSSSSSATPRWTLLLLCQSKFFSGGLEGIGDLIITASAHLGDPAASISLLDPFSLALPYLVTSISSLSSFIYLSSDPPVFWGFLVSSVPPLFALRPVTAAHIPENTTSCVLGRPKLQQNEDWSNCPADE